MKIVVATKNQGKIREIKELLGDIEGLEILSMIDFDDLKDVEIEENGATFEENAYIKALFVAKKTGLPALADDSGLEVDVLGGRPGVKSARFGGPGLTDGERNEKLLALLKNVPLKDRTARFKCVMVLVVPPDFERYVTYGVCEGVIVDKPRGTFGFGYDPIFYLPKFGKTMAELTTEEKNAMSHRGKALRTMKEIIKEVLFGKSS
ncbi:MAG: XTP/dITP diphosphatase [Thermosulfidibacteraceae bacterium]